MAQDMLQKCPDIRLHRITSRSFPDNDSHPDRWVELPLRTPCADALSLRATLHRVLGSKLRGYRLALDASGHQAIVTLQLRDSDVPPSLQLLAAAFPAAEFGRVARPMPGEVGQCH